MYKRQAFDVANIRFSVSNKRKVTKQTAVADREIEYIYPSQCPERIEANSEESFVFVFDKFTIARKKFLYIDLWEQGERDLSFRVKQQELLQAKILH